MNGFYWGWFCMRDFYGGGRVLFDYPGGVVLKWADWK